MPPFYRCPISSMTNFGGDLGSGGWQENFRHCSGAGHFATTNSEGGFPGRYVRPPEPKTSQTRFRKATAPALKQIPLTDN